MTTPELPIVAWQNPDADFETDSDGVVAYWRRSNWVDKENAARMSCPLVRLSDATAALKAAQERIAELEAQRDSAVPASSTAAFAGWFRELPSAMGYRLWEQR